MHAVVHMHMYAGFYLSLSDLIADGLCFVLVDSNTVETHLRNGLQLQRQDMYCANVRTIMSERKLYIILYWNEKLT